MPINGIDLAGRLASVENATASQRAAVAKSEGFAGTLALRVAEIRSQTFGALIGITDNQEAGPGRLDSISRAGDSISDLLAMLADSSNINGVGVNPVSSIGRNTALHDPEAAYRMMTDINNRHVLYQAQYAELDDMKVLLADLQQSGEALAKLGGARDSTDMAHQLEAFATQYNQWIRRFDESVQGGGLLADTQAAQVARYELEQSIGSMFHGARDGMRGLSSLGFSIDPTSKLLSLDRAAFDRRLGDNNVGVINTLQEFGVNFAKSAALLSSPGNFISNQLNNLHRAIDYIEANKSSLQAEFGLGDAANPPPRVAKALAAYQASTAS